LTLMVSETNASDRTERPPDRRKLIAVVHADVVGYSRLIGLDDSGTLDRMRRLRRDVIEPALAAHGGRIVSTPAGIRCCWCSTASMVRHDLQ